MNGRPRFLYLFRDVPPGALFVYGGALWIKSSGKARLHNGNLSADRVRFPAFELVAMSEGEARGATRADVVAIMPDSGAVERAPYREQWAARARSRAGVIPCRFVIHWRGRWRRLYSDTRTAPGACPHFINCKGARVAVDWRTP